MANMNEYMDMEKTIMDIETAWISNKIHDGSQMKSWFARAPVCYDENEKMKSRSKMKSSNHDSLKMKSWFARAPVCYDENEIKVENEIIKP